MLVVFLSYVYSTIRIFINKYSYRLAGGNALIGRRLFENNTVRIYLVTNSSSRGLAYTACMSSHKLRGIGYIVSAMSMVGLVVGALAITETIPMRYVWGGRLESRSQLILMEAVTLLVNATIVWFVGMRAGYMRQKISQHKLKIAMLLLSVMMLLNTIGNIAAKTNTEKLFAIPTLLSAIGFWLLYRNDMLVEDDRE